MNNKNIIKYKGIIKYNNKIPTIKTKILDLSSICRYKDGTSQNRPDRYYFDVTTRIAGLNSAYTHACYFDNAKEAKKNHKELSLKYYDQLTSPFLSKIKSKHMLTLRDKERILELLDKIDEYKKIDEVILR